MKPVRTAGPVSPVISSNDQRHPQSDQDVARHEHQVVAEDVVS